MLVGDDLVEALEALLARRPAAEDAPGISYVDGALAGLLLLPEPIAPEEWLPRLGAGPEAAFADPDDRERLAELLQARKAEIAGELLQGGLVFAPIYEVDQDGQPLWQLWLLGLAGALALRREHWDAMLGTEDEDAGAAIAGLMSLLAALPGFAEALPDDEDLSDLDELVDEAPDLLPYFVEVLYRRRRGLPRVVLTDDLPPLPPAVPKVGRNDPCPCGSGKKYKKCCGG
jgi:uncharacterized protein